MSLKQLGGETIVYGLSNILGRLLNYVVGALLITHVIHKSEFGVVNDLMFWTGLLIALLVFRMDTVVFRYASRAEYDKRAVFRRAQYWVVTVTLPVTGLMLLLSGELADWLSYPDRAVYAQLVILTVAFDAISAVPLARLRLEQRPWFFVLVNLGNVLINIALLFLTLWYWRDHQAGVEAATGLEFLEGYKVGYFLFAMMAASAFRFVLLLVDGAIKYGRWSADTPLDDYPANVRGTAPSLKTMLNYAYPLTIVAAAGIINFLVGPSLIKLYYGGSVTENLGYSGQFGAAMKMAVLLNLFIYAYNYAAEPFFFRQTGKDVATADRTIYADAARAYALVAALASAGILLFLPWLRLMIDEEEAAGLYVLPALLAANFLFGLYANLSVAYKLTDKTIYGGGIALLGSTIVIGGSIWWIPVYGLWAVALSMLTCFAVMCVLAYAVSRRFFPVDYPLGRILLYGLLTAVLVYAGYWSDAFWWRSLLFLGLSTCFFILERKWVRRTFL